MAKQNNELAVVDIQINSRESAERLKELERLSTEVKTAINGLAKDSPERAELKKTLKEYTTEAKTLRKEMSNRIDLVINGDGSDATLRELRTAANKLKSELAGLAPATEEYIKKNEQLTAVNGRLKDIYDSLGKVGTNLKEVGQDGSLVQLEQKAEQLKNELKVLNATTDEFANKNKELAQVNNEIDAIKKSTKDLQATLASTNQAGSFNALKQEAEKLKAEILGLDPATEKFIQKSTELKRVESEMNKIEQTVKDAGLQFKELGADGSITQLEAQAEKLRKELLLLSPAAAEFETKSKAFQQINGEIDRLNKTVSGTPGFFARLKNELSGIAGLAIGYLGLQALGNQITNIISKNAALSDSLADVRQTTGFTAKEVQDLNKALGAIDTRTATSDLRDIAKVGGQFGVAKNEILEFSEAMNEATVVLKSEFKGGAEEITTTLSGLRNVLTDVKTANISDDLRKLGNGLIVLAQQGNATAPVVADFANRIAGIGIPLGLSSGQVLGLSATMQELSISTERGGTAVAKILQKMTTNTAEFAKIAGVPLSDFKKKINEDILGAFELFLKGTVKFKGDAIAMGGALKDLETTGGGVSEVLSKLGANTGLLAEKVKTAGIAIQNTNAITEQYKIKNENLGAELDKLGKKFYSLVTSSNISAFLASGVRGATFLISALSRLPEWLSRNAQLLIALSGAMAVYYANTIRATVVTIANTTALAARNAVVTLGGVALVALGVITGTLSTITGVLTGRVTLAAAAQAAWNVVMSLNPIGLLITGITAFAIALNNYASSTRQAIALETEKIRISSALYVEQIKLSSSLNKYNKELEYFNRLSPEQQQNLKTEIDLKVLSAKASYAQILAEQQRIRNASSQVSTLQFIANSIKAVFSEDTFKNLNKADALEAGRTAAEKYEERINGVASVLKGLEGVQSTVNNKLTAFDQAMAINAKSVDQYQAKLDLLKVALNSTDVNSDKYALIETEVKKTETGLSTATKKQNFTGDSSEAQKAADELAAKYSTLYNHIRELQVENISDEKQRELARLQFKYELAVQEANQHQSEIDKDEKISRDKKKQFADGTAIILKETEAKYLSDKKALENKFIEEQGKKEYDDSVSNLAKWHNEERSKIIVQLQKNEITKEEFKKKSKQLESDYYDYIIKLAQEYGRELTEVEKKAAEEKIKGASDAQQKIQSEKLAGLQLDIITAVQGSNAELEARKRFIQEKASIEMAAYEEGSNMQKSIQEQTNRELEQMDKQYLANKVQMIINIGQQLMSIAQAFQEIQNNRDIKELRKYKTEQDQKKKVLDARLKAGVISRENYDSEIAKLDDAYHAKEVEQKHKAFKTQKKLAIINAIINTALAVTQALASSPPPYSYIMAGIASALGNVQVVAIESQTEPEYQDGRKPLTGTVLKGPSHAQGGVDLVEAKSGKVLGNMEGNEGIFSAKSYKNNPEIIDAIFEAGGDRISINQLPPSILPPEQKVQLQNRSTSILEAKTGNQLSIALFEYQDFSNSMIETNRLRVTSQLEMDNTLEQNNIRRTKAQVEYQKELIQVSQLQHTLQQTGINLGIVADERLIKTQRRIYNQQLAHLISDADDGAITQEQFAKGEKQLNTALKNKNVNESTLQIGERKQVVNPFIPQQFIVPPPPKTDDGKQAVNFDTPVVERIGKQAVNIEDPLYGKQAVNFDTPVLERIGKQAVNIEDPLEGKQAVNFDSVAQGLSELKTSLLPFANLADVPQLNTEKIIQASRLEQNASAITVLKELGFFQAAQAAQQQQASPSAAPAPNDAFNEKLSKTLDAIHQHVANLNQNGVKAEMNYFSLERDKALINDINDRSTFK